MVKFLLWLLLLFFCWPLALLALALTFALDRGWLTVALALMVPGIAWISEQRPLPALRYLAAAMIVLVLLRVGYEPRIVGDDVGTTPIFNWLLYGYGVPAVSFWYAGYLLRRRADDGPTRMADAAAILFTVLLVQLEIRHYMNNGNIYVHSSSLAEIAMQVSVGLAMTIGLERLRQNLLPILVLAVPGVLLTTVLVGLVVAGRRARMPGLRPTITRMATFAPASPGSTRRIAPSRRPRGGNTRCSSSTSTSGAASAPPSADMRNIDLILDIEFPTHEEIVQEIAKALKGVDSEVQEKIFKVENRS